MTLNVNYSVTSKPVRWYKDKGNLWEIYDSGNAVKLTRVFFLVMSFSSKVPRKEATSTVRLKL